jgi:hypothetical protein
MIRQQDMLFQQVSIHYEERSGWVRIFTEAEFHSHSQLPLYLSETLSHWFRQHPQLCLRDLVPINRGGDTVELHAWYDLHVFPAPSGGQTEVSSRDGGEVASARGNTP